MTDVPQSPVPALAREVNLREATALNIIDMIGVGPFVTIPLIIHAMHGPQAMLGWVLGAGLAMCDGLVWAELGASMPQAGGSYQYLKESYGAKRLGRLMSFLFVWQLIFSAPLSIASGCLGIARYAEFVWPSLAHVLADHTVSLGLGPLGALSSVSSLPTAHLWRWEAACSRCGCSIGASPSSGSLPAIFPSECSARSCW